VVLSVVFEVDNLAFEPIMTALFSVLTVLYRRASFMAPFLSFIVFISDFSDQIN
jgi:hypothetical protein